LRKAAEVRFVCQACGFASPRWLGRCPSCQGWNTLVEEMQETAKVGARTGSRRGGGAEPTWVDDIPEDGAARVSTGVGEFDRVLGGGLVAGSFVLIGGDPGIGKSTLLLQAAGNLAKARPPVLYVSAEESAPQVKLRARRLGVTGKGLAVLAETRLESIEEAVEKMKPAAVVVDSIQTVWSEALGTAPGSVGQVRECAGSLMRLAKTSGCALAVVCHVTKDGTLAGPKVLEHLADCVLSFEGDRHHLYRILRGVKNRFGSTSEIGVFEMNGAGLKEVPNLGSLFLSPPDGHTPGKAVAACLEGTRPLLVEVQALTGSAAFGVPQRRAQGIDPTRLTILLAVLEKRLGFRVANQDVFLNIPGGLTVEEPAVDLACALAIASALRDRPLGHAAFFGEVGLSGEIRPVPHPEHRMEEAVRLGFQLVVAPAENLSGSTRVPAGLKAEGVRDLSQALDCAMH